LRRIILPIAALAALAACSKGPAPAAANAPDNTAAASAAPAGPTPKGTFTANGKTATMTYVRAYKHDPMQGKPVVALVFSPQSQAGASDDPVFDAGGGKFGDPNLVAFVADDGTVVAVFIDAASLTTPHYSANYGFTVKNFTSNASAITGELTTGGPVDAMGHQKIDVDVPFAVAPPK
jgi:hypothetical protein